MTNNNNKSIFAIKKIKKSEILRKNMQDQVITERNALAVSKNPFIAKLNYSFQSKHHIYLVMDYYIGMYQCRITSIY